MANHKVTWETDEYGDFNWEVSCLGKAGDDCWRFDWNGWCNCCPSEWVNLDYCSVIDDALSIGWSMEPPETPTGAWEITFASWIREYTEDGVIKFTEPLGPPVPITIPMKGIQK